MLVLVVIRTACGNYGPMSRTTRIAHRISFVPLGVRNGLGWRKKTFQCLGCSCDSNIVVYTSRIYDSKRTERDTKNPWLVSGATCKSYRNSNWKLGTAGARRNGHFGASVAVSAPDQGWC